MDKRILEIIEKALLEDGYDHDITTEALIDAKQTLTGYFIAKASGVISGIEVAQEVFHFINPKIQFTVLKASSSFVKKGDVIAHISGSMADILRGERVALNLLQRMSGIATLTSSFVAEVKGTDCKILDTRKTDPLIRILEKQAVVDGGGTNHRFNLSDQVLIKDNHIAAVGSIKKAVETALQKVKKGIKVEVEVETKDEFLEALETGCHIIMFDNMTNELMGELVKINDHKKLLEASGNMTLKRVHSVAMLGVDYISVGALTHSYKSLDISLKFQKQNMEVK
jgi:nicotinate-nucleotide pyrophosphorylase (carboxylating)